MPVIVGDLAICDICDTIYWIADWDSAWDFSLCPACIKETKTPPPPKWKWGQKK